MSEWILVVPREDGAPSLVDVNVPGEIEKVADSAATSRLYRLDVDGRRLVPVFPRVKYVLESAEEVYAKASQPEPFAGGYDDLGVSVALPPPPPLPQRRPRREEVLSGEAGQPPSQFDEEFSAPPLSVGDWQPEATGRGFGPFRRSAEGGPA